VDEAVEAQEQQNLEAREIQEILAKKIPVKNYHLDIKYPENGNF